ncbi:MAG TPA: hypothetical protein VN255_08565, partial [Mycobacterium sp.]|nr:hypothetical protein [Mycobacterium sp.]
MSDQPPLASRQPAALPTRMSRVRTHQSHTNDVDSQDASAVALDPEEAADRLLRDLRSTPNGLSTREA